MGEQAPRRLEFVDRGERELFGYRRPIAEWVMIVVVPLLGVDAVNTFRVIAGRLAYFRVVSRRLLQYLCSSARFL
jgi:hypothetical protein